MKSLYVSLFCLTSLSFASEPVGDAKIVTRTPGLVAFWTFGEPTGASHESTGTTSKHPLREVGGPIERMEGGSFSGYSAHFNGKQYFRIPHEELGDLDIGGPDAQVSMFAVIKLTKGKTIAGIWSEGKGAHDDTGTRQYAMLMDMPTYGGAKQLTPHISSEGGFTRRADGSGLPWCADYAASISKIPENQWVTLGFTYDAKFISAYFNGILEKRELDPAKDKRTDPYFTKEGPNGGSRGMNPYYHGRGIFKYDAAKHASSKIAPADFTISARYAVGSMLGEALIGDMCGLAVFSRALSAQEMQNLHNAANIHGLK